MRILRHTHKVLKTSIWILTPNPDFEAERNILQISPYCALRKYSSWEHKQKNSRDKRAMLSLLVSIWGGFNSSFPCINCFSSPQSLLFLVKAPPHGICQVLEQILMGRRKKRGKLVTLPPQCHLREKCPVWENCPHPLLLASVGEGKRTPAVEPAQHFRRPPGIFPPPSTVFYPLPMDFRLKASACYSEYLSPAALERFLAAVLLL